VGAVPDDQKETSCDKEYEVRWQVLKKGVQEASVCPKILAFDIEVNSSVTSAMPADKPEDAVFQLSCVITEKDKPRRKILLSLKPSEEESSPGGGAEAVRESLAKEGISVHFFENEKALLLGFMDLVSVEKPNVITGFNIFGFDVEYVMKRTKRFHIAEEFKLVGFYKAAPATEEEIKWSSNAYKHQSFKYVNWEGILLVDLLPMIQRDFKLDTYTLKNVSSVLLKNNTKDPVSHKDIFRAYRERTPGLMALVGKYCVQDSDLCIELMNHLHTWISLSEMARCCNVPMFVLFTQGQQIRLYSQVYKYCANRGFVVTTDGYEAKNDERFRGALVHEPTPGYYKNVCPLDFASLYPSIIIGYNLCYSTFVPDFANPDPELYNTFEWEDHVGCEHDPNVVRNVELTEEIDKLDCELKLLREARDGIRAVELKGTGTTKAQKRAEAQQHINELVQRQKPLREARQANKKTKPKDREDEHGNVVSGIICAKRYYRFYKPTVFKGVVPTIIQNLIDSRTRVKQLMKTCPEEKAVVYDKEQLSYKVSANSFYGSFGVARGYLAFMPCAMTVTYCGREAISNVIKLAKNEFAADLVMSDTDSTYLVFRQKFATASDLWKHASSVADKITNWEVAGKRLLPKAVKLEFENVVYSKFLILAKKMYLYKSSGADGTEADVVGKKGVVLARRDNSQVVRTAYEHVARLIFDEQPGELILAFLEQYVTDLLAGKTDPADFVVTKSVGETENTGQEGCLGDYKIRKPLPTGEEGKVLLETNKMNERAYYVSQLPAQVQLAERMKKRGVPIAPGSRIEYIVIKKYNTKTLGQKIESFEYFLRHKDVLSPDLIYYAEALINPISQLLKAGVNQCTASKFEDQVKTLTKAFVQREASLRPKLIFQENLKK
jgi:DNA polymerase elongation subunit (family B)